MLYKVCLTDNQTRVHVRPYGLRNSDYINASFVEVRRGLKTYLQYTARKGIEVAYVC